MLKSSLTSLAAVLALAAAVPGVADAAAPTPRPLTGAHAAPAKRIATRVQRRLSADPSIAGTTAVAVKAGATGDGPADQDECDDRAQIIDEAIAVLGRARSEHVEGSPDWTKVEAAMATVERTINVALDRGCFVVY
jgi:hypothetical protein